MQEVINSLNKWFKDRFTSPLYGTFILSLVILNWRFFYVLFWPTDNKVSITKLEYIDTYVMNVPFFQHLLFFIILPGLFAYIIIWWLPIITNKAHDKSVEYYHERKRITDRHELEYEKEKQNNLRQLSSIKRGQAESKKVIESSKTQEDVWLEELQELSNIPSFAKFDQIKNALYSNSGATHVDGEYGDLKRIVESDVLGIAHSRGLVTITGSGYNEKIDLTEKGKFFMSRYLNAIK